MTPEELRSYVEAMREMGVTAFECATEQGPLKIALGPAPARPLPPRDPDAPRPAPRKSDYERLLFACTEGIDEDNHGDA